jgi:hypothetical protein
LKGSINTIAKKIFVRPIYKNKVGVNSSIYNEFINRLGIKTIISRVYGHYLEDPEIL